MTFRFIGNIRGGVGEGLFTGSIVGTDADGRGVGDGRSRSSSGVADGVADGDGLGFGVGVGDFTFALTLVLVFVDALNVPVLKLKLASKPRFVLMFTLALTFALFAVESGSRITRDNAQKPRAPTTSNVSVPKIVKKTTFTVFDFGGG